MTPIYMLYRLQISGDALNSLLYQIYQNKYSQKGVSEIMAPKKV